MILARDTTLGVSFLYHYQPHMPKFYNKVLLNSLPDFAILPRALKLGAVLVHHISYDGSRKEPNKVLPASLIQTTCGFQKYPDASPPKLENSGVV